MDGQLIVFGKVEQRRDCVAEARGRGGERPVHFARGYAQSGVLSTPLLLAALRMPGCGTGVPPVDLRKRPAACETRDDSASVVS
jgi:hypothetical protein